MVKLFVTTCGTGPVDGWVLDKLVQLPDSAIVDKVSDCDLVCFVWTWRHEYLPDPALVGLIRTCGKPVVVFDYLECIDADTMYLTTPETWKAPGLQKYQHCAELGSCIKLYFKREYNPAKCPAFAFPVVPTDFITPEYDPALAVPQSREEFNARPIDIFFYYGFSSPDRPLLHAELIRKHFPKVCAAPEDIDYWVKAGNKNLVALLFVPHFRRYPIEDIMKYQRMSKLSVCLRGAAWKCFRHAESPYTCVMAMQDCPLQFAFPWTSENCVILPNQPRRDPQYCWLDVPAAASKLGAALGTDLYPVYLAGMENARRYTTPNYLRDYWIPKMREAGIWP